jgi:hypothetical protein
VQDITLIKRKLLTIGHMAFFYITSIGCTLAYIGLVQYFNQYVFFFIFWLVLGGLFLLYFIKSRKGLPFAETTNAINPKTE